MFEEILMIRYSNERYIKVLFVICKNVCCKIVMPIHAMKALHLPFLCVHRILHNIITIDSKNVMMK